MPAPHFIIGTAGHVDHGKTALIRRLTGINTDRLKEEQERELSIDLGFAYFDLPDGRRAGIVDVPGHERFVKNMLAGATGMDVVLLVVAADEGVMPQTREHLDIIRLLGIERGIIVLTKTDLVDQDWLQLVEEDVRAVVADTVFARAPLLRTSAETGEGYAELQEVLAQVAAEVPARNATGPCRLPIDRVFTIRGHGTVVTGTLWRGSLRVDDPLEVLPTGLQTRCRGLQVHNENVSAATAGQRVAVNLARLSTDDLRRGDVAVTPGSMQVTSMLDASITILGSAPRPLRNRNRVRVHLGAAELIGRVILLESDALDPGEAGLAQLRLEAPTAAARGDRFVLRQYSPMITIAGGEVIDPAPHKHRRYAPGLGERLRRIQRGTPDQLAADLLVERGLEMLTVRQLAAHLQVNPSRARELLRDLVSKEAAIALSEQSVVARPAYEALCRRIRHIIETHHREVPLDPAMTKHALQTSLGRPPDLLLDHALEHLARSGELAVSAEGVRLPGHEVRLTPQQEKCVKAISTAARRAGVRPLTQDQLIAQAAIPAEDARALIRSLVAAGELIPVQRHLYHREVLEDIKARTRRLAEAQGPFTLAALRDLLGSTRRFVVPLAEYFDAVGFTRRIGDLREIAEG